MNDSTDDRIGGIDLRGLGDDLERLDYPVTEDELLATYGDRTLDLEGGRTTLRTVLAPRESTTFESSEAVVDAVYALVGSEAVGREEYTDRGTGTTATADDSF
ncbi:DUF5789 family protein [Salinigranum salinum]|uniref:DUF5789 family protein n=1 Tax=Salinigranum salinum TaxID=1364937 RepID=UPI0012610533|nr:hypothetical protein [Salinigranum salinum]